MQPSALYYIAAMTADAPPNVGLEIPRLDQIDALNLRERARRVIRSGIITGRIEPGRLFPVSYFTARLGVSATPVREALLDLANHGLVEVVRNKGFRVPVLTEHDLDEIFDLRLLLEVHSIGELAGTITPQQAELCAAYANQLELFAMNSDIGSFLEADHHFHTALVGALGNRRLVEIIGRLRDQTPLFGLPRLAEKGELPASAREHHDILNAVVRGDRDAAMKLMTKHIRHTRGIWAGREEADSRIDAQTSD